MTETVPLAMPMKKIDLDLEAERIRALFDGEGWRGELPVDIERLFELDVKRLPGLSKMQTGYTSLSKLGYNGVLGVTDADARLSLVDTRLYEYNTTTERRVFRATTGHELSHCILHVNYLRSFRSVINPNGPVFRARKDIAAFNDPEWQAWGLCGALLMPKGPFLEMVSDGAIVPDLAERFDVNPKFVLQRAKFLGCKKMLE